MRKKETGYKDQLVDGATLQKAIKSGLKILGARGVHSLFYDLESRGIVLQKGKPCSLKEVCTILNELFGWEATSLIMDRIHRELKNLR